MVIGGVKHILKMPLTTFSGLQPSPTDLFTIVWDLLCLCNNQWAVITTSRYFLKKNIHGIKWKDLMGNIDSRLKVTFEAKICSMHIYILQCLQCVCQHAIFFHPTLGKVLLYKKQSRKTKKTQRIINTITMRLDTDRQCLLHLVKRTLLTAEVSDVQRFEEFWEVSKAPLTEPVRNSGHLFYQLWLIKNEI